MTIKPSPTIAGKLRKLFNNNKQTIEPAIGDSIPGGGGANVLTLYGNNEGSYIQCYLDPSFETQYTSYEEALSALNNADIVKVVLPIDAIPNADMVEVTQIAKFATNNASDKQVACVVIDVQADEPVFLLARLYPEKKQPRPRGQI